MNHNNIAMMRLTVIFFMISCLSGKSMDIDSLKVVWKDSGQSIENRMNAFEKFIWNGYLFSQPDSAFYYCQLKFDLAEKLGLEESMANALRMQGMSWGFRGEYEKAILAYNESQRLYEKVQDFLGMGRIQSNLGVVYTDLLEYDKALEAFDISTEFFEKINAVDQMGLPLSNSGRVYYQRGNFDLAMDKFRAAIPYLEKAKNKQALASVFNGIASIYKDRSKYRQAIQYLEKSLKMCEELNEVAGMCAALSNISSAYRALEDYESSLTHIQKGLDLAYSINNKAYISHFSQVLGKSLVDRGEIMEGIHYLKKAIGLCQEIKSMQTLALSLSDLGAAYSKLSQQDSAMHYLDMSYKIAIELNDQWCIVASAKYLADLYRLKGDYTKSINYGEIAIKNAQKIGSNVNIADAAQTLYISYKETKNSKKALEMLELHIIARDSIRNEENIKELAQFEFKNAYEKKALADSLRTIADIETRELNHQVVVAEKEAERNLYASGGILLLLMTFIFFQRKVNKSKLLLKEQEAAYQKEVLYATINSQETERRRIARDLHDEVGAMLATIKLNLGSVNIKLRQVGFEDDIVAPARNLVDDTISNVRSISKNLLPPTLEEFGLAHALSELADKVQEASGINIEKDIQLSVNRLEVERELAIFRIIQEMMNNALKHSSATMFKIVLKESNGQLEVMFSDNGVGFDLNAIKNSKTGQTGMGLKNLENRAGAAGAEIQLSSLIGQGTKLSLKLPVQFKAQYAA